MFFKIIAGVNCAPGNNYVPYNRDEEYTLIREHDFSTSVYFKDPPIEYIDIPNKEDVMHMCTDKYFKTFRITLNGNLIERIQNNLSISRERYMKDCITHDDESSLIFLIDPRDPGNIERFEKYLGLRENELTAEIIKNNVE